MSAPVAAFGVGDSVPNKASGPHTPIAAFGIDPSASSRKPINIEKAEAAGLHKWYKGLPWYERASMAVDTGLDSLGNSLATHVSQVAAKLGINLPVNTANHGLLPVTGSQQQQIGMEGNSLLARVGRGFGHYALPGALGAEMMPAIDAALPAGGGTLGAVARGATSGGLALALQGALSAPANASLGEVGQEAMKSGALGAFTGLIGPALGAGVRAVAPRVNSSLVNTAQRLGIPLTFGEASNSPLWKRVESTLERVPGSGMWKFRARQAAALENAGKGLGEQFNPNVPDVNKHIESAAQDALSAEKAKASELYNALGNEAEKSDALVEMPHTQEAAKTALDMFGGNDDLIQPPGWLNRMKGFLTAEPRTFEQARRLRSAVQSAMRDSPFGSQERNAWSQIQGAIEKDIGDYANKEGGNIKDLYDAAQQHYRENVVPFKDAQLSKLASGKMDTDTLIRTFVKNNRPQLAAKLYEHLTPDGQASLKYAVFDDAVKSAQKVGERSGTGFSPATFAKKFEDLGKTKGIIYSPEELKAIDGYAKLARTAESAGRFQANPVTGAMNLMPLMTGAELGGGYELAKHGHPYLAVGLLALSNGGRRLLTNQRALQILGKIADSKGPATIMSYGSQLSRALGLSANAAVANSGEK